MGWRIVQITKPCKISLKNRQLFYEPIEGDSLTIPLEDISVIILEHKQILFSNSLLAELSEYDIVLFTCDSSHNPSGVFFPFHNHSRYSEIAWQQLEISEPLKKRLWQEIVKQKIINQAKVLEILQKENAKKLIEISKHIQSGDAKNSEAFAANIYWKSLFKSFNRNNENDIRNSALNYGYAVIRGCVARSVVGAGLLPCFGIHHANKLNQFNLVDDLIEPFRPFIDYQVYRMDFTNIPELTPILKNELINMLTKTCFIQKEEINLLKSCEIVAISVAKSVKEKNAKYLKLPTLKKLPLFK